MDTEEGSGSEDYEDMLPEDEYDVSSVYTGEEPSAHRVWNSVHIR